MFRSVSGYLPQKYQTPKLTLTLARLEFFIYRNSETETLALLFECVEQSRRKHIYD
jgi:hypothetical protein